MILDVIEKRYQNETETQNLGCANIIPYLNIKWGDKVLDLGCGKGLQASKISDMAGDAGLVYGIDLTSAMIEHAKALHQKPNLFFITGDIHSLPFEADFFHWVSSNCVINHSTDKAKVYQEIYRVLKKGGTFVVADVMAVEKLPAEVSSNPDAIAACYGGAILKEEYLNMIKNQGFNNIREHSSRVYPKNGFLLESIILSGVKQ